MLDASPVENEDIKNGLSRRLTTPLRWIDGAITKYTSRKIIAKSGLFDHHWYLEENKDVGASGVDPIVHFIEQGAAEGRDPNILFDTDWYVATHPDVRAAIESSGLNPLVHYIFHGAAKRLRPHPLFDTAYYLARNADVARSGVNPLAHYLAHGGFEERRPNQLFNSGFYLASNPDVARDRLCPLGHFVRYGAYEGRPGWTKEEAVEFVRPHLVHPERRLISNRATKTPELPARTADMRVAVYANSEGNYCFFEIRDLIVAGLKSIGVSALALDEKSSRRDSVTHDIVIAPHEFFYSNDQGREWRDHPGMNRFLICLNTEQLQSRGFCLSTPFLLKSKLILDMNSHTAAALRDLNLNAAFLPLGYLETFKPYCPQPRLPDIQALASLTEETRSYRPTIEGPLRERPLDLLFVGTVELAPDGVENPLRRDTFFSKNARQFSQYECFLVWMNDPIVQMQNAELPIDAMIGLSQRAKILVNIGASEMSYFQWQKIVLHGIWQKTLVITEKLFSMPGLVSGLHYFECTLQEMPGAIDWLLRDPEGIKAAEKIRNAAFEALKNTFDLSAIMHDVVDNSILSAPQ